LHRRNRYQLALFRFRNYLALRGIRQAKVEEFEPVRHNICPVCGSKMLFLDYQKKRPPDEIKFGEKMDDWKYILARPT